MDLHGKKALVTGAASGIGLECVRALMQHGVQRVAILDVDEQQGQHAAQQLSDKHGQGAAIFVSANVCDDEQLKAAFQTVVDTFQGLDIVINNAGVLDDCHWQLEISINFGAVVRSSLLALHHLGRDQGGQGGVILNIASILGLAPLAGAPVYVATKHAVVGFSRSLGLPYHEKHTGVRVVALCPGVTATPLVSGVTLRQLHPDWGTEAARELGALPQQKAEDVAAGVVHALQHGCSGSVWVVEGGQPVYEVSIPHREDMCASN